MRAVSMYFSVLHDPRCRVYCLLKGNAALRPLTRRWCENGLGSTRRRNYCMTVLGTNSKSHSEEGIPLRSWKQQRITRKVNPGDIKVKGSKPCAGGPSELLDAVVTAGTTSEVNKSIIAEECISLKKESKDGNYEVIKFREVQQKVESRGTQRHVTIIVFDTETTGLSRKDGRLVEIALRDLSGGVNSTFHTLINPECNVPNAYIHGITTNMVRKPDVPRFKDLIPILREYVRSRQVPGAPVLWVAHNARCFDVPFLINEFNRCSEAIPSDWLFLDTLPLARELAKLEETKGLSGKSIKALREYYGIQLIGEAHRAMSDVHSLAMILREITIDLKLPVSSLLERSFKASDLANSKKKKTEAFVSRLKTPAQRPEDDKYPDGSETGYSESPSHAAESSTSAPSGSSPVQYAATKQPTPAVVAPPAPVPDLLGDLMGLDNSIVPVDTPATPTGPPLPVVLPSSTGQGLQISAQLTRRDGQIFFSMLFKNYKICI